MKLKVFINLVVLCCILWCSLYKLDHQPMYLWDESRQANNALEMFKSGNLLESTYEGKADFWNTKPHLLILLQAASFKLFGSNLFALRLPSALAIGLAVFIWYLFLVNFRGRTAALLFVIIMLSCRGAFVYHIGRTGDYDALLALFISVCWIVLFQSDGKALKTSRIYWFCFWFLLALLTKSLAALIWMPIFGFWILLFNRTWLGDLRRWILPVFITILIAGAYYILRETLSPGYISAVVENEILGRYLKPNEGHVSTPDYYLNILSGQYFQGFLWFLIIPMVLIFLSRKSMWFEFGLLLVSVVFVLIISFSQTRIHWYLAPVIPLLAIFVSLAVDNLLTEKNKLLRWCGMLVLPLVLVVAWFQLGQLWFENLALGGVQPQYVLQQAEKTGKMPYQGYWLHRGYSPIEKYYTSVFKDRGIEFKPVNSSKFFPGDTVYFHQFEFNDTLHGKYQCRQHHAPDADVPVWVFVIDGDKSVSGAETETLSGDISARSEMAN